jgi:1,4-alpha-glucan branching enzyme
MVIPCRNGSKTFVCDAPSGVKKVYLVGDFNLWSPTAKQMKKAKDGTFRATVSLPSGRHQYKFLVDGQWMIDETAEGQVLNPYGTYNSVVKV